MGGAWEKLVRTSITVLKSICPNYLFNDESLRCALMERPLTSVNMDFEDDLLMGSSIGYKPINEGKMNLRRHWNEVKLFRMRVMDNDRFDESW